MGDLIFQLVVLLLQCLILSAKLLDDAVELFELLGKPSQFVFVIQQLLLRTLMDGLVSGS